MLLKFFHRCKGTNFLVFADYVRDLAEAFQILWSGSGSGEVVLLFLGDKKLEWWWERFPMLALLFKNEPSANLAPNNIIPPPTALVEVLLEKEFVPVSALLRVGQVQELWPLLVQWEHRVIVACGWNIMIDGRFWVDELIGLCIN